MFKEFDEYISEFEADDFAIDYWYDEGVFIAQEMLQDFTEEDWNVLSLNLPVKSIGWKRRLAYCLHDGENIKQLEILLELIDSDDSELFELVVDSLRSFSNEESRSIIQNNEKLILKVKELLPSVGDVTKKIFQEFLD